MRLAAPADRRLLLVATVLSILAGVGFGVSIHAQSKEAATTPQPQTRPGATSRPAATRPAATRPAEAPEYDKVAYAVMSTSMGDILLELNHEAAPISVENFLAYVNKKFFDGTIFHRVKPGFMIQGGGFTPDGKEKKTEPGILNEWENGLKNLRGSIAMARIGGRPNSGTSQFFINHIDNGFLDQPQGDGAGYAVFGKVLQGMDVVDKIAQVPTGMKGNMADWPREDVMIKSVRQVTADDARKIMTPPATRPAATMPATTRPAATTKPR